MKYGAVFPTTEIGNDPIAIRDFAQAAEALGYARLTAYDHVLGSVPATRTPPMAGPYTHEDPFHEPMVLFGFLAGATRTIELATGVLILPQRQTVLVAKQAAEVDLLSGGRLVLGVGTGWNHVEYGALGMGFRDRARRFDEQVEVLRALWGNETLDYEGTFHRIDRAGLLPRPPRPIPVWFGGGADAALERAARLGDGFIFGRAGGSTLRSLERLGELLAAAGRERSSFGTECFVDYSLGPDAWREHAAAWAAAGGDMLSMRAMSTGAAFLRVEAPNLTSPAQHIAALETFMTEVRSG